MRFVSQSVCRLWDLSLIEKQSLYRLAGYQLPEQKNLEVERIDSHKSQIGVIIKREFHRLRQEATQAAMRLNLPELNRTFGATQALQDLDLDFETTSELDALIIEIRQLRDRLHERLGAISTLLVTGDTRHAYTIVRDWIEKGAPVAIDSAGNFGAVGEEVDIFIVYRMVRDRYLASLVDLAQQRRSLTSGLKEKSPKRALEILNETLNHLSDEILTVEDKEELKPITDSIRFEISEINMILGQS